MNRLRHCKSFNNVDIKALVFVRCARFVLASVCIEGVMYDRLNRAYIFKTKAFTGFI